MPNPLFRSRGLKDYASGQIPSLRLWLQAESLGLNNSDPVATWNDLSVYGNTASQSTAAKKPLYTTNVQNGRPGVLFDGVDDFMTSTLDVSGFQGLTMIGAVVPQSTATTKIMVAQQTNNGGNMALGFCVRNLTGAKFSSTIAGANGVEDNIGSTAATTTAKIMTLSYFTGSHILYLNGSQDTSSTTPTGNVSATSGAFHVGAYYNAGTPALFCNYYLLELLVFNARLSMQRQKIVESYLNSRYAIY